MIEYRTGDAANPWGDGVLVIAHVCNNKGGWGAGFTGQLSKRWTSPETAYRSQVEGGAFLLRLGDVQAVQVNDLLWVANMVAQDGYRTPANPKPINYEALEDCLTHLGNLFEPKVGFHMPRIGCGLGGGTWPEVERIINKILPERHVFVYDL